MGAMVIATEDHIADGMRYGHRFDIGMPKDDRQAFERRVKQGTVVKVRALWPWFDHGTIWKTCFITTETGMTTHE